MRHDLEATGGNCLSLWLSPY